MKRRHGFTLVELLLTLGVLAIGLTTLLALVPRVGELSRAMRDRDRAAVFAESVFASAEWAASLSVDEEAEVERAWTLPTAYGAHKVRIGEEDPVVWPSASARHRLYYHILTETNATESLDVWVEVRPVSHTTPEVFHRVLPREKRPW